MNEAYGYHIARLSTNEEMGVEEARPYRYLLRCEGCGMEFKRYRASPLTEHPERYRCRCGGRLIRVAPEGQF
jgi:predicted SprT family Zn-dependent metalloprotease